LPKLLPIALTLILMALSACDRDAADGGLEPFAFKELDGYTLTLDQFGRTIALVPEGPGVPEDLRGFSTSRIIRVPSERIIIASGTYDASIIFGLGKGENIVATAYPLKEWSYPVMRERIKDGRIAFIGSYDSLDYEAIRVLDPGLILISSHLSLAKLEELGLPTVGTYDRENNGLENRLGLIGFLGGLLGESREAGSIVSRIRDGVSQNT
jgi:iron complex transport system substrate-binding protein